MEQEFRNIDSSGRWQNLYNDIRNQTSEYPYKVAKLPANWNLNRYRDVSPYDHSRVKLENSENDYINASLVEVKEAQRAYILSQGPLRNTCGHFWLMIWEQCSKAVIMLNRVIEKGSEKCAQYWPTTEELQMSLSDTGFVVRLLSEEDHSHYTIRVLDLQNTNMERSENPSSVDIQKVLLGMREYRMGLIQTPDQLRFSYMAVLEGARLILGENSGPQKMLQAVSKDDLEPDLPPPPPPPRPNLSDSRTNGPFPEPQVASGENLPAGEPSQDHRMTAKSGHVRKRHREDKADAIAQKVQQMKQRLKESERKREQWQHWRPILLKAGISAGAALVVGFLYWMYS
ncbi:tyrosine-protein phosphatase non-receptor type 2a isoform 3-T3 [Pholidichthys leucotaenia]